MAGFAADNESAETNTRMTRRTALQLVTAASATTLHVRAQQPDLRIVPGPFTASRASLMDYRIPDWYADAKFGIWAHWGPQSAPEVGDWYARNIYIQGHRQYEYHVKTYGHPSKFGSRTSSPPGRLRISTLIIFSDSTRKPAPGSS